jgi:hypothetical protein
VLIGKASTAQHQLAQGIAQRELELSRKHRLKQTDTIGTTTAQSTAGENRLRWWEMWDSGSITRRIKGPQYPDYQWIMHYKACSKEVDPHCELIDYLAQFTFPIWRIDELQLAVGDPRSLEDASVKPGLQSNMPRPDHSGSARLARGWIEAYFPEDANDLEARYADLMETYCVNRIRQTLAGKEGGRGGGPRERRGVPKKQKPVLIPHNCLSFESDHRRGYMTYLARTTAQANALEAKLLLIRPVSTVREQCPDAEGRVGYRNSCLGSILHSGSWCTLAAINALVYPATFSKRQLQRYRSAGNGERGERGYTLREVMTMLIAEKSPFRLKFTARRREPPAPPRGGDSMLEAALRECMVCHHHRPADAYSKRQRKKTTGKGTCMTCISGGGSGNGSSGGSGSGNGSSGGGGSGNVSASGGGGGSGNGSASGGGGGSGNGSSGGGGSGNGNGSSGGGGSGNGSASGGGGGGGDCLSLHAILNNDPYTSGGGAIIFGATCTGGVQHTGSFDPYRAILWFRPGEVIVIADKDRTVQGAQSLANDLVRALAPRFVAQPYSCVT